MLWSLLKIFIFLGIATAAAFGAAWILETPGEVSIAFAGREFVLSPIGFVIAIMVLLLAAYILFKLVGLLVATIRFLLGDETAVNRYFSRSRERRGLDALSDGVVALASGDSKVAGKKARKAEKLLNRPELTQLLSAQAADMAGDRKAASTHYQALLPNDRTRFVAIRGLMSQKLEEGDTDTALALAKKAFALRPDNPTLLRQLFDLQTSKQDWGGARATLNASMHARMLPRDVGSRRDAVLSLADARSALADGNNDRSKEAAIQANKLAPTLVPAAAMAARAQAERGAKRKATRILTTAWAANPHPELAEAFATIDPTESRTARRARFETLTAAAPRHVESQLLTTELALAAEDFPAARKALGNLAETAPTTRSLALMAAIERGQGAPETVVRGWLAKALSASRGPQWICEKCNHIHASWAPVCENCGAFDTLMWKEAPAEDSGLDASAMLPLIIGTDEPEPEPELATDAETATETPADAERDSTPPPRPDIEDADYSGSTINRRANA